MRKLIIFLYFYCENKIYGRFSLIIITIHLIIRQISIITSGFEYNRHKKNLGAGAAEEN